MGRPRDLAARDRILDAAYDLVTDERVDSSINAIVARARVGKATVYRWWSSRTAVVLDTLLREAAEEGAHPLPQDTWAAVRAILEEVGAMVVPPRTHLARDLLAAVMRGEEEAEAITSALLSGPRNRLVEALGRGIAQGQVPEDLDVPRTADQLLGPLWLRLLDPSSPASEAEVAADIEAVIGTVVTAVGARG